MKQKKKQPKYVISHYDLITNLILIGAASIIYICVDAIVDIYNHQLLSGACKLFLSLWFLEVIRRDWKEEMPIPFDVEKVTKEEVNNKKEPKL